MTLSAYKSGRVTKRKGHGNREFISCLACVSAIGKWIPPVLVYKGLSNDLRDTWVKDVERDAGVHFASTENGWSCNALGLQWLKKIFERYTKPKNDRTRRLLLIDGHSSHVNMDFIDWADRHRIIVMILPPHTTHRLQPLDVGMFQALSTAYSKELDDLMDKGIGRVHMSKRFFYKFFKRAWDASFTEENIQSAFRKPGVWPVDGKEMIAKVSKPEAVFDPTPSTPSKTPKTPLESKALRQARLAMNRSPSSRKIDRIFKSATILSAQVSILQKENEGLVEALALEKDKRKKGRKLNLCGKESSGVEIYSPGKVVDAREYMAEKDAKEQAELEAKEARKVQRAANALIRKQKEAEKEARQAAAQLAKELRTSNPAPPKTSTQKKQPVVHKAKETGAKVPKAKAHVTASKEPSKTPAKSLEKAVVVEEVEEVVIRQNSRGRTINLPERFKNKKE